MEKIKISKKIKLTELAGVLLPYFIQFFGHKYIDVIVSTFKHSLIYEWNKETKENLVNLIGYHCKLQKNINGFMCKKNSDSDEYNLIVINGKQSSDEKLFSLIHELTHAIISEIDKYIIKEDVLYERNGISLINYNNKNDCYNVIINEGIVEYITDCIVKSYCPNIKLRKCESKYYGNAKEFAKILFETFNKEDILDILIFNKGSINMLYYPNDYKEFNEVSKELDKDDPFLSMYIHKLKIRNKERNDINARICSR